MKLMNSVMSLGPATGSATFEKSRLAVPSGDPPSRDHEREGDGDPSSHDHECEGDNCMSRSRGYWGNGDRLIGEATAGHGTFSQVPRPTPNTRELRGCGL